MKNILYLSLIDWFWIKQRPQHMSEFLSKSNFITYLCRKPWKNNSNVIIRHSNDNYSVSKSIFNLNPNLNVIRKRLIPKEHSFRFIQFLNNKIMKSFLLKLDKKNNYDYIIITHPKQYDILPRKFLNSKIIIYDCMDNYKCWPGCNRESLIDMEKKVLNISSYVIASSENLYNELINYDVNIKNKLYIINNGVDIESFDLNKLGKNNEVNIFKNNNKKRVGYVGTISKWVDLNLVENIAIKNKNLDFYIIGPIENGTDIRKYKNINNIIFTASQPYYSIPNILSKLDITIMPFKKIDLVDSVNPVKVYEYLAMGKPVIALRYTETEKFGDLIYLYDNADEFQLCLNKILNCQEDSKVIENRMEFAKNNSWENRVNILEKMLNI